jgi:hypothetical protein
MPESVHKSLNSLIVNWVPLSVIMLLGTSSRYMISLMNSTVLVVTSLPLTKVVSPTQDHYGVSLSKQWHIIYHIQQLNKWNTLNVKLYYKLSFELKYRGLSGRLRLKDICGSDHSMNQEWHLSVGMPYSEIAHTGRGEREGTPAKQHQSKVWATKA